MANTIPQELFLKLAYISKEIVSRPISCPFCDHTAYILFYLTILLAILGTTYLEK